MDNHSQGSDDPTEEKVEKWRPWLIKFVVWGLGAVIIYGLFYPVLQNLNVGPVGFLIIVVFIFLLTEVPNLLKKRSEQRNNAGEQATEVVEKPGELLDDLDRDKFYILHNIRSPQGVIDHVVLDMNNGIFLIEIKALNGRIEARDDWLLVNGSPLAEDHLGRILRDADWLSSRIEAAVGVKPPLTPVLTFKNAFVLPGSSVRGVDIINEQYLSTLIQLKKNPNPVNALLWEKREELKKLFE